MVDLGTLGGHESLGFGLNNSGVVVGRSLLSDDMTEHAFIYQNGAMVDLNTLIPHGTTLIGAVGINDVGKIVAFDQYGGYWLLTPGASNAPSTELAGNTAMIQANSTAIVHASMSGVLTNPASLVSVSFEPTVTFAGLSAGATDHGPRTSVVSGDSRAPLHKQDAAAACDSLFAAGEIVDSVSLSWQGPGT
jgi:probable HAF family extracellular repeat protein